MNLLKKFVRNDNADLEEDYDDIYVMPDDLVVEMPETSVEEKVSALDSPARKEPEIHPASLEKVSLKLLQPRSHTEATFVTDKLKSGCIVLLDMSQLPKDQARRFIDFLSGVAYALDAKVTPVSAKTYFVASEDMGMIRPGAQKEQPLNDGQSF